MCDTRREEKLDHCRGGTSGFFVCVRPCLVCYIIFVVFVFVCDLMFLLFELIRTLEHNNGNGNGNGMVVVR